MTNRHLDFHNTCPDVDRGISLMEDTLDSLIYGLVQELSPKFGDTDAAASFIQVTSEAKSVGSLSKSIAYKEGTAQVYSRVLPKSLTNLLQPYLKFSGGFGSLKRW